MEMVLQTAHRVDDGRFGVVPPKDLIVDKLVVELKDIVLLTAKNVDLEAVNKSVFHFFCGMISLRLIVCFISADSFTDLAISSKTNSNGGMASERVLTAWVPDSDIPDGEALEDHSVGTPSH